MGVMKVLSTTNTALCFKSFKALAIAAISNTFRVGFVGVSSHTKRVVGLKAALKVLMSEKSTKSTSISALGFRMRLR